MFLCLNFVFSLYPWALLQDMPCGPGIHWDLMDRDGNERDFYTKKTLLPGSSLAELRYLMFLSHHDSRFRDADNKPYPMMHAFYRGQKVIEGYKVDGFCQTPETNFVIEFNGCRYHQPCPHYRCKFNENYDPASKHEYQWFQKEETLRQWCSENNRTLIVKWECQFAEKNYRYIETNQLPRIMRPFETRTAAHISKLVLKGELFGFCEVTLKSPQWLIEKYKGLNFPPIIRRGTVTLDMVSPFMQERLSELDRDISQKGKVTVINAWHAEKIMLYTPMLKWLLELGVEMTDVFDIVQYTKSTCFSRFIKNCVDGRIRNHKKPTAAQTFKIAMNSR